MPQIHVPLLLIGSELGGLVLSFTACAPRDDNYTQFFQAANPPAIEVTQLDVGHGQYVDEGASPLVTASCVQGKISGNWVRTSSAAYLTALLLGRLKGDADALTRLDAQLVADEAAGRIRAQTK